MTRDGEKQQMTARQAESEQEMEAFKGRILSLEQYARILEQQFKNGAVVGSEALPTE